MDIPYQMHGISFSQCMGSTHTTSTLIIILFEPFSTFFGIKMLKKINKNKNKNDFFLDKTYEKAF